MLKVGVQSASWYKNEEALKSFEYIKECGFDAVDFNIDTYMSPGKMVKEGIYETVFDKPLDELLEFFRPLKEASEQTGVAISQMHAPFPCWYRDKEEVNAHVLMALDKCFAVCEYVGCPAIVVHASACPSRQEEWDKNLAFYRSLIPYIQKYKGVKICLENLFGRRPGIIQNGRLSNPEDSIKMLDLLNEESGGYFGFCLDVGHANLTRLNLKDFIRQLGPRLTIMHIHDNNGLEDLHMIPYSYLLNGTAHVCDWAGFAEALKEIGYDGTLAFETFRIFSAYPKGVHTEVLKLISAIGRTWKEEIEAE